MGMLKDFRDFAMRGNVLDMAVGIIIGAAFGKVVNSAVSDILMPPLGKLIGGVDFSNLFISLSLTQYANLAAAKAAGVATINYGLFLNTLVDFTIQAFAIFLLIKAVNAARARFDKESAAAPPPPPTEEVLLLREIRDALKNK